MLLDIAKEISIEKVKRNLRSEEAPITYPPEEIEQIAESSLLEYKL